VDDESDRHVTDLGGFTLILQRVLERHVLPWFHGQLQRIHQDVQQLFLGQKEVVGSTMGTQGDLEAIVSLVADGAFEPAIGQEYTLDETARAFQDMQDRDAFGQQIIRP